MCKNCLMMSRLLVFSSFVFAFFLTAGEAVNLSQFMFPLPRYTSTSEFKKEYSSDEEVKNRIHEIKRELRSLKSEAEKLKNSYRINASLSDLKTYTKITYDQIPAEEKKLIELETALKDYYEVLSFEKVIFETKKIKQPQVLVKVILNPMNNALGVLNIYKGEMSKNSNEMMYTLFKTCSVIGGARSHRDGYPSYQTSEGSFIVYSLSDAFQFRGVSIPALGQGIYLINKNRISAEFMPDVFGVGLSLRNYPLFMTAISTGVQSNNTHGGLRVNSSCLVSLGEAIKESASVTRDGTKDFLTGSKAKVYSAEISITYKN